MSTHDEDAPEPLDFYEGLEAWDPFGAHGPRPSPGDAAPDGEAPTRGELARVYVTRATDGVASMMASYVIPLLVLVTTGSPSLTGVAYVLEWVPRLTAFGIAGSLVDRWGPNVVFGSANLARAFLMAAAAAALKLLPPSGPTTTFAVMALGAASGMLAQGSFIAAETVGAAAGRRLGTARAHRVQAMQTNIDQGALLIGPFAGGVLLYLNSSVFLCAVAGLSLAAAMVMYASHIHHVRSDRTSRGNLLSGLRIVRSIPALWWLVLQSAAVNLASGVLQSGAPIVVVHNLHRSTAAVGAVWCDAAIATLIVVALTRHAIERWGLWRVGTVAAALSLVSGASVALAPGFPSYTAAVALFLSTESVMLVTMRSLRAQLIPHHAFGATLSASLILAMLPVPVAGALVAVVPAGRLPELMLACAVLQGVVATVAFLRMHTHMAAAARDTPTDEPSQAPGAAPLLTPRSGHTVAP